MDVFSVALLSVEYGTAVASEAVPVNEERNEDDDSGDMGRRGVVYRPGAVFLSGLGLYCPESYGEARREAHTILWLMLLLMQGISYLYSRSHSPCGLRRFRLSESSFIPLSHDSFLYRN
jgi:hypothetical protein